MLSRQQGDNMKKVKLETINGLLRKINMVLVVGVDKTKNSTHFWIEKYSNYLKRAENKQQGDK